MKRKLALAMSAIMTVAMVPTTAFAATKVTAVDEITTGVDKIFTSRVELKNDNDQSDIVTSDGTFVVRATLTNGKFARVNDDDDNNYQMDSVTGPADYDWDKTGVVDVDVLSDTTANVTLKASVFNQSSTNYTEDWKDNWIATHPDEIYAYWKANGDTSAAKTDWLTNDTSVAGAVRDKWVNNTINQNAAADVWKTDAANEDLVKAAWVNNTGNASAIEQVWIDINKNDVKSTWITDNATFSDYNTIADITNVYGKDVTADQIKSTAMNNWIAEDSSTRTEAAWNDDSGITDANKLPYCTAAAWELANESDSVYSDAYAAAVTASEASVTTAQDAAWTAAAGTPSVTTAQNDAWTAYADKTTVYETAYTTASTAPTAPQSIIDAQDAAWTDSTIDATDKETCYQSAYTTFKASVDYAALATAAVNAAYTDANPADVKSCVLPIIAKTVDAGDVVVKFTSNVAGFKSASEVIAKAVDGGDADITVEGVRTFVEDGKDIDTLKEITINELTPDSLKGNNIELKLKGNWEYVDHEPTISFLNQSLVKNTDYTIDVKDDIITIKFSDDAHHGKDLLINDKMLTKMTISGIQLDATKKCDSGDVATITVSSKDFDTVKLEVAKMVEEAVTYSVEDKKLPTIWAGKNYAIDDDANTLKLSVEENQGDILNTSRKATFTFPEGIEVVGIADEKGLNNTTKFKYEIDENVVSIWNYQKGTDESKKTDFSLKFILNAAPTFSGDVEVTLGGEFDDTSFKVATVKAPYTVEAKTSEVLIDYRYVPVNDIVITEAEDGILKEDDKIVLAVEKMNFEDAGDVKVTDGDIDVDVDVDSKGNCYLYDDRNDADYLVVTVKDESTDASTIVISGLELYLDRTLPVGGYALENVGGTKEKRGSYDKDDAMKTEFSKDAINVLWENSMDDKDVYDYTPDEKEKSNGIFKYKSVTANDEYINVITAARDQDDSMTTKKIIITVGAATMTSGTETVTLDAPAYINSANYTMLPLRAISEAFGATVNWDDATRTVTILKGQRVISMTIGSRTMYVNGTPVAMNTAPEISKDRSFVPVRDLSNAFGISNINWTEASGTVTLN